MQAQFADQLAAFIKRTKLSVRRVAYRADLPHQTLFNWLRGTRPRWHRGLVEDLRRLGAALEVSSEEMDRLLILAGCLPDHAQAVSTTEQATNMPAQLPWGWFASGSHPAKYEIGVERTVTYESARSASIRAREAPEGFGTLMQEFRANAYRNKRLRLSAMLRSTDVAGWAGLWMRVTGPGDKMLSFDNMQSRPIIGTTDWTPYTVVLDVPQDSEKIAFGMLLSGAGQVWVTKLNIETVDCDVPTTDQQTLPDHPVNLDFSE
ncbi:MAG: hypothetical protein MI924_28810 [Chloroflexales bacterium]|nr:hypothetical protein [Chloroflexales bacterium]